MFCIYILQIDEISPCNPESWDIYFDKTAVKSKLFTGMHEIICSNILYMFIKC